MDNSSKKNFICDRRVCQNVISLLSEASGPKKSFEQKEENHWRLLVSMAEKNNITPLLYRCLQKEHKSVPRNIFWSLQKQYLENLRKNVLLEQELLKLLKVLANKLERILLMKGISFSRRIFNDPGARIVRDIDLLIPEKDIPVAEKLLCREGYAIYQAPDPKRDMEVVYRKTLFPHKNSIDSIVELHWNIVPPDWFVNIDVERIFQRSMEFRSVAGIRIFSPEDELLALIVHAIHHYFSIRYIIDIAAFLSRIEIKWDDFVSRAEWSGLQVPSYIVFQMVKKSFQIEVPGDIEQHLKPGMLKRIFVRSLKLNQRLSRIPEKKKKLKLTLITIVHKNWILSIRYLTLKIRNKRISKINSNSETESNEIINNLIKISKNYIRYIGYSMYPTFKEPEFLVLKKVNPEQIKVGDVIAFKQDNMPQIIVHRVIKKEKGGVFTKGDNNELTDPTIVLFDQIHGKVFARLTKGKQKPVFNGRAGLIWMKYVQLRKEFSKTRHIKRMLIFLEKRFYVPLPGFLKPDLLIFERDDLNVEIKVFWLGNVVGRYNMAKNEWDIPVLFRILFKIDYLNEKFEALKIRNPNLFKNEKKLFEGNNRIS